ncbi:MAG: tetratricopeptide repeat protein [Chloroflexota bacterium]
MMKVDSKTVDGYMDLAQQSLDESEGPNRAYWINRLEEEHVNLQKVFDWLIEQGDAERSLRLAYLLQELWFEEHHTSEARDLLAKLLAMPNSSVQPAIRAQSLDLAGAFALAQDDFAKARSLTGRAVEICRGLEDKSMLGSRLVHLGHIERYAGNYEAAQIVYQEALQIFQTLDHPWWLAVIMGNLASTAVVAGDFSRADPLVKECLQRHRELDAEWELAQMVGTAAGVAAGFGQHERAICLAGASAAHRERIGVSLPPIQSERFEQMIVSARQALDESTQARLWDEGLSMTLDQAVNYALE